MRPSTLTADLIVEELKLFAWSSLLVTHGDAFVGVRDLLESVGWICIER